MLQAITRRLKRGKRGISTVIVVMLSLVLVVIIVSNVVLWSYQMNQFDIDRMQETFSLTNATSITHSSWIAAQTEFSVNAGTKLSGSYTDTTSIDSLYESFREEAHGAYGYNPSDYVLSGSTTYVSGSTTDLTSNDAVYMTFRSYVSSSSATSPTDAFVAYRDSTTTFNTAKERTWTGASMAWSVQNELPTSGSPVRWVRVAYCPIESRSYEKIAVTLSDDGYLDAYVWTGTEWTVTNDIAFPGTSVNVYRCFDVVYEQTSGRALLVYSKGTSTNEMGYKIWAFGTGWGSEQLLDLTYTTGIVRWVSLASCPTTRAGGGDDNEIALIYLDSNTDVHGYTWNGSAWGLMGATAVWDNTAAISSEECIAIAYEQTTGEAMFIWADSTTTRNYYRTWDGTTLGATTRFDIPTAGNRGNWVTLKADPASDDLLFTVVDADSDLNTAYWNGSGWAVHSEHDGGVDTHAARCADFAWEPTGSKGLLVYGTATGQITYKTFTAPNTWTEPTNTAMSSTSHRWVQLRTNPRNVATDVEILGAVLDSNNDLGAIQWNDSTFTVIGTTVFSSNTGINSYECFEIEFANFGVPVSTCEVELSGTASAQEWTQVEWTADLSFTTSDVAATLQLYDYSASQYPSSGDGYMTATIGQADTTKSQQITTAPVNFRDANGNWKIKITATKTTDVPFELKIDWVELKATTADVYRLNISNDFATGLSADSREGINNLEILIRYNVTENAEKWFLKAYNWAAASFSDAGFNTTGGSQPALGNWTDYAVAVTGNWGDYVNDEGIIRLAFFDEGLNTNQTIVGIDFLGVRTLTNGTLLKIKNSSPLTIHIVAVWIADATTHQRYSADLFLNSGETAEYIRMDVGLPQNAFVAKVVTERGNIAVFSSG